MQINDRFEFELTIIVTVVGGMEFVRRSLSALCPQVDFSRGEIIVPYDSWSANVGELAKEFPHVRFHFVATLGMALDEGVGSHQHRLYDRRRAVGISLARGRIVAMTEDYAIPDERWCREILSAHAQPYAAIGGIIDNAVDHALNWALYYCDFGRYGSPLRPGPAEYISDVNVAYKHEALESVRSVWLKAYHETLVHWALRARGETLYLDPRLSVFEHRPRIKFSQALRERFEWGRVFAETRVAACSRWQRVLYALGTSVLPLLLLGRVFKHMHRQRRSLTQTIKTLPLAAGLLLGWSLGEFTGYVCGPIAEDYSLTEIVPET